MSLFCPGLNGLIDDICAIADEDRARARFEPAEAALGPANPGDNDLEQNIPANNLERPGDLPGGPSSQMDVSEAQAIIVSFVLCFCLFVYFVVVVVYVIS